MLRAQLEKTEWIIIFSGQERTLTRALFLLEKLRQRAKREFRWMTCSLLYDGYVFSFQKDMCKHWWSYPMSVILFKTIVLKWIRSHLGRRGAHKSIFSFNVNDFCKFFFLIFETHPYMYISYSRKILLKTLREKNKQKKNKIKPWETGLTWWSSD